ncbi:hypothetical protein BHM03_00061915, partial [Ensete ventricosum]
MAGAGGCCDRGDYGRGKKRQQGATRAATAGSDKGYRGGKQHCGVRQRSTRLGAMCANGAGSERRKGEQGSGLTGGEEEAIAGGHGEDSDGRLEEAAGTSTFGVAVVAEDESGREEGIGKLTRNTLKDRWRKTIRLAVRMSEAVGLAG